MERKDEEDRCLKCRFFIKENEHEREDVYKRTIAGDCRHHSPVIVTLQSESVLGINDGSYTHSRWPSTHSRLWCGDFKEKA